MQILRVLKSCGFAAWQAAEKVFRKLKPAPPGLASLEFRGVHVRIYRRLPFGDGLHDFRVLNSPLIEVFDISEDRAIEPRVEQPLLDFAFCRDNFLGLLHADKKFFFKLLLRHPPWILDLHRTSKAPQRRQVYWQILSCFIRHLAVDHQSGEHPQDVHVLLAGVAFRFGALEK